METELENVSSSPLYSDRISKVYLSGELQQAMWKFKNETGMLKVEFLALEKVKIQKEVEVHLLLLCFFLYQLPDPFWFFTLKRVVYNMGLS